VDDDKPTLLLATFCVLHDVETEEKGEEVAIAEQRNAL
jgi:hypothetical protein